MIKQFKNKIARPTNYKDVIIKSKRKYEKFLIFYF